MSSDLHPAKMILGVLLALGAFGMVFMAGHRTGERFALEQEKLKDDSDLATLSSHLAMCKTQEEWTAQMMADARAMMAAAEKKEAYNKVYADFLRDYTKGGGRCR